MKEMLCSYKTQVTWCLLYGPYETIMDLFMCCNTS